MAVGRRTRETPAGFLEGDTMARTPSDAIVLLSGGLDSATTLAIALSEGHRCHAVTFRYGQRHELEVASASRVAAALGAADHRIVPLSLGELGGSALTDMAVPVPEGRSAEEMSAGIPATYVPARNTVFLAHALALAEVTESDLVYLGVNSVDYSGYPDCRPEYVDAFRRLARLATRRAVEGRPPEIVAPLQYMGKAEIIRKGAELGVDFSLTLSCYNPDAQGRACGRCDACALRRCGFVEAGVPDPTVYRPGVVFTDRGA
jgi:7-cyano-7-deazaguanine synthase